MQGSLYGRLGLRAGPRTEGLRGCEQFRRVEAKNAVILAKAGIQPREWHQASGSRADLKVGPSRNSTSGPPSSTSGQAVHASSASARTGSCILRCRANLFTRSVPAGRTANTIRAAHVSKRVSRVATKMPLPEGPLIVFGRAKRCPYHSQRALLIRDEPVEGWTS